MPPYRVAKDAGQTVKREQNKNGAARFYVEHPGVKDARLYITGHEFVDASKSTGFFGGTVFDYLALFEKDMESAVRVFMDRYREKIRNVSSYEESLVVDQLTKTALRARRGFEWFNGVLTDNYQKTEKFHSLTSWYKRNQINPLFMNHWAYFADGKQVEEFFSHFYDSPGEYPFEPEDGNYLVVPYYNTWSSISHIKFEKPDKGRSWKMELNPSRMAFAGLHGSPHFRPERAALFFDMPSQAMGMQSYYRDRLDDCLCLHPSVQSEFENADNIRFRYSVVMATERTNFSVCSRIYGLSDEFFVQRFGNFAAHGECVSWPEYIAQEIMSVNRQDGIRSPRLDAMLGNVDLDSKLRDRIVEKLKELGSDSETIRQIGNWAGGSVFKLTNCTVEETSHGYTVSVPNRNEQQLITNFTITVDRNVVMGETNRILLTGNVRIGDIVFPYVMDKKASTQPRQVEDAILTGFNRWVRSGSRSRDDQRVPVVTMPDRAKVLAAVIAQKCAQAPYYEGFDHLGWIDRETFVAPFWMRRELNLSEGASPVIIDGWQHNGCYRFSAFPRQRDKVSADSDVLVKEARELLCMLVVWLVRGRMGYDLNPVKIKDAAPARNILKAVCSVFGQVAPITLNPNSRRKTADRLFPNMLNLPAYAVSDDFETISELSYPVWVLCENGMNMDHGLTNNQLHDLTGIVYSIVNKVIDWMMTSDAENYVDMRSDEAARRHEAFSILQNVREMFGPDIFVDTLLQSSPTPMWNKILSGQYDRSLSHLIRYDLNSEHFVLKSRQTPAELNLPYRSRKLAEEARSQGYDVFEKNGYFWFPAEFVNDQQSVSRARPLQFALLDEKPQNPPGSESSEKVEEA